MKSQIRKAEGWFGIPPWIILGAVIVLVPIFAYWGHDNINKQRDSMTFLLLEKGAALIRSFEAGARTGMMGMMGRGGGSFQLQRLLMETAKTQDINYIMVTGTDGTILAHNNSDKIGAVYQGNLNLGEVFASEKLHWREVTWENRAETFEVFRKFSPIGRPNPERHKRMMESFGRRDLIPMEQDSKEKRIIFVGLNMGPIKEAVRADTRHTVAMGIILLLVGFAGIFSLFLLQAYRSARSSLTEVKAFSDNVVENMPIGLLAVDTHGKIISFNQTAESILGLPAAEILGQIAKEVMPRQLECLTGELGSSKGIIEREIKCHSSDGRTIPMDVIVSRLEGHHSTFLGYLVLFRDLTEIQELKREIERNERLASLGRLAAGVAHEIRNPLSSIKGFATYFRERYKDIPEDRSTADIMIQEVERLNRVITQLLEFARPMEVEKRPSSILTVIQHSLRMIEREAREKNIDIRKDLSPGVEMVTMDQDRISQVLLNLYLNALEAMDDGGILGVEVSESGPPGRVVISVSDTGVGIKKEDLARVFDPYFTTKQSGTGLGLAIVHKIVESHGGELKVESEVGKGTTVTVILSS